MRNCPVLKKFKGKDKRAMIATWSNNDSNGSKSSEGVINQCFMAKSKVDEKIVD